MVMFVFCAKTVIFVPTKRIFMECLPTSFKNWNLFNLLVPMGFNVNIMIDLFLKID